MTVISHKLQEFALDSPIATIYNAWSSSQISWITIFLIRIIYIPPVSFFFLRFQANEIEIYFKRIPEQTVVPFQTLMKSGTATVTREQPGMEEEKRGTEDGDKAHD